MGGLATSHIYMSNKLSLLSRLLRQYLNRLDYNFREMLHGATIAFVLRIIGGIFVLGFNVLLARVLGTKGSGTYYLALTVITIASVFCRMGMDNSLIRFIAINVSENKWDKVAGVFRKSIGIAMITSIVATLIVFIGASWISKNIFSEPLLEKPLRVMALGILPLTLFTLYSESLRGLKKIRDSIIVQNLSLYLIGLPLLAFLGWKFGINGAAVAYIVSASFATLVGIVLWRVATPQLKDVFPRFDTALLIRTSLPLLLVASIGLVMAWTDTIMLGIMTDSDSVGIYNVATRTALMTSFIVVAINSTAVPQYAALYAQNNQKALSKLASSTTRLAIVLTIPAFLLFIIAPEWVLLLFGKDFKAGANVLSILALGQLISIGAGPGGYVLAMTGKEIMLQYTVMLAALLNLVLNYILINKLGMVGAAMATSISTAFIFIVQNLACRVSLKININPWP